MSKEKYRPGKKMVTEEVVAVPTERELKAFNLADPTIAVLVARAQQSDAADRELTIGQAVRKYKKAVFWALLLSIALVMEGYDIVVVSISL